MKLLFQKENSKVREFNWNRTVNEEKRWEQHSQKSVI